MKRMTIVIIILLLAISYGYSETQADHWEKVRQMDELAERFKAETGFIGRIDRDNQRECLGYFRGNFPDVNFPNQADTLAMRQSCDAIFAKIFPYFGLDGIILTKTSIRYNKSGITTRYEQLVHGYGFEHPGEIIIGYSRDSDDVTISNGIIKINIPPVNVNYTFAQAVEIARQHYIHALGYPDTLSFEDPKNNVPQPHGSIIFRTIKNNGTKFVYDKGQYRLCHIFGISILDGIPSFRAAYIDAQTGEVFKISDDHIEFNSGVQGEVNSIVPVPTTSYADAKPAQADHWEKVRQLDQLAEKFKAETGFTGVIGSYPEQMKLGRFTGNFDDINMTNVRDSIAFRQVCIIVINKLLPYIGAENDQLMPGMIDIDTNQISTRYYQIVNGYKVESSGYLNIYYLFEEKRFGILDVTEEILPKTTKIFTIDEVNLIVLNDRKDGKHSLVMNKGLLFSRQGSEDFYLAYKVILCSDVNPILDDYIYWVHAETGKIMFSKKEEL